MKTGAILEKYSYLFFAIGGGVLVYSLFRFFSCPFGANRDFCKLAGIALWSFYGLPALILGFSAFMVPKITKSRVAIYSMLGLLILCTIRIVTVVLNLG